MEEAWRGVNVAAWFLRYCGRDKWIRCALDLSPDVNSLTLPIFFPVSLPASSANKTPFVLSTLNRHENRDYLSMDVPLTISCLRLCHPL